MRLPAIFLLNDLPRATAFLLTLGLLAACQTTKPTATTAPAASAVETPVWHSDAYTLYPDRVVQGQYEARGLSATELVSNCLSPANDQQSPRVEFKFSLRAYPNRAKKERSCFATLCMTFIEALHFK